MSGKPAKRRKGESKEDIKELNFGEDFSKESGVTALLNAEVKVRQEGAQRCRDGTRAQAGTIDRTLRADLPTHESAEACRLRTRVLMHAVSSLSAAICASRQCPRSFAFGCDGLAGHLLRQDSQRNRL